MPEVGAVTRAVNQAFRAAADAAAAMVATPGDVPAGAAGRAAPGSTGVARVDVPWGAGPATRPVLDGPAPTGGSDGSVLLGVMQRIMRSSLGEAGGVQVIAQRLIDRMLAAAEHPPMELTASEEGEPGTGRSRRASGAGRAAGLPAGSPNAAIGATGQFGTTRQSGPAGLLGAAWQLGSAGQLGAAALLGQYIGTDVALLPGGGPAAQLPAAESSGAAGAGLAGSPASPELPSAGRSASPGPAASDRSAARQGSGAGPDQPTGTGGQPPAGTGRAAAGPPAIATAVGLMARGYGLAVNSLPGATGLASGAGLQPGAGLSSGAGLGSGAGLAPEGGRSPGAEPGVGVPTLGTSIGAGSPSTLPAAPSDRLTRLNRGSGNPRGPLGPAGPTGPGDPAGPGAPAADQPGGHGSPAGAAGPSATGRPTTLADVLPLLPGDRQDMRETAAGALTWLVENLDRAPAVSGGVLGLAPALAGLGLSAQQAEAMVRLLVDATVASFDRPAEDQRAAWLETGRLLSRWLGQAIDEAGYQPPYWTAVVEDHERRSGDLAVLRVRPLLRYPFLAGQYTTVEVPAYPGDRRPCWIASAPLAGPVLEVHVLAGVDDPVGVTLVERCRIGETIRLGPAAGGLLPELTGPAAPLLMVAEETGIAAVRSLVRQVRSASDSRQICVFWLVPISQEPYDRSAVEAMVDQDTTVVLVRTVTELLARLGERGPWDGWRACVAGSQTGIAAASTGLGYVDLPSDRVHVAWLPGTGQPHGDGSQGWPLD